jgi:hypothetical protein
MYRKSDNVGLLLLLLLLLLTYNVKVKQSITHQWRRKGWEDVQLLLIHDFGTRWGEWSASRPSRALPPWKGPPII